MIFVGFRLKHLNWMYYLRAGLTGLEVHRFSIDGSCSKTFHELPKYCGTQIGARIEGLGETFHSPLK